MAENMSQDLDSYLPEILLENSIGHLEEMNHLWSPRRSCPVSEAMLRPAPPLRRDLLLSFGRASRS